MDSKPLSYIGLKTVLQHMEANKRFECAQHIPSIRMTEKLVPLKINYLYFDRLYLMVNKTKYQLAIYRERYNEKVSSQDQCKLGEEYIWYDLDKYGFTNYPAKNALMPGDILTDGEPWEINERVVDEEIIDDEMKRLEADLQRMEKEQSEGKIVKPSTVRVGPSGYTSRQIPKNENTNLKALEEVDNALKAIEKRGSENSDREPIQYEDVENDQDSDEGEYNELDEIEKLFEHDDKYPMEILKKKLLPYYCQRDDTPYPYDAFIQLTIIRSCHFKEAQRIKYNMKLHEAMKLLNTFMFGKRRDTIQVKHFNLDGHHTVLRVPFGLKLRFRQLSLIGHISDVFKGMRPIVEDSSYPLDVFDISSHGITNFNHPIVKTARKLIISNCYVVQPWLQVFLNLTNKIVHCKRFEERLTAEDYVLLIRNWIETGRKIGTRYSFEIKKSETATTILELIKERFNGDPREERYVTVQMSNSTKLDVSYLTIRKTTEYEESWLLKMEIKEVVSNTLSLD